MANSLNVNIKMYRTGEIGDCFLLRFSDGQRKTHILIDCGSFRNGEKSKNQMNQIAADIKTQLEGNSLDIVVGTHQHNDHLSGFLHAKDIFESIGIEKVWLPWVNDPADADAVHFQQQHQQLLDLVAQMPQALREALPYGHTKAGQEAIIHKIEDILQFYGIDRPGMATNSALPSRAISFLKSIGKAGAPEYLYPGQVPDLPGFPSDMVKVYVFGPPKDHKPLKGVLLGSDQTVDHRLALNIEQTEHFLSALASGGGGKLVVKDKEEHFPFREIEKIYVDEKCYRPEFLPQKDQLMAKIKQTAVYELYQKDQQQWRTIENNWMEQAESMALYLNDLTNNSSLVLAFELVQSKKVLLFAGDAQTDNWRSWSDIKWPKDIPENKTERLLANTVLYKVGHHGSHNGTYKPAFEKMRHPELVAMIPVDRTDPNIENTEYPWQMPAVNLYEDLKKQTNHKILRMDDIVIMEPPLDRAESNRENWKKWKDNMITNDLYVELNIR